MTFDVVESLSGYIKNTAEPMRWFPIMGLIILWFEARYLMFQSPKKKELEDQLSRAQLLPKILRSKAARNFAICISNHFSMDVIFFIYFIMPTLWLTRRGTKLTFRHSGYSRSELSQLLGGNHVGFIS